MIRDEIEPVETTSPDLLVEQTEQLKLIFPQVFSEGKIDFKKLRAALGDVVDTQPQRYSFAWAGKRNATLLLQTPSHATLTPSDEESVNFESTANLFIEGDNLEVLKLLYKSYSGRVKMIYIDPPYNTGGDFVYPDNYADPLETYLEISGQKDANGNLLTSNPETSGRYHSAWLSMIYPRLYLSRQMLREDGVIFVSIDDHEIYNLRLLMNEVFGEENFVAQLVWQKGAGTQNDNSDIAVSHEYVLVYARNINSCKLYNLPPTPEMLRNYNLEDDFVLTRGKYQLRSLNDFSIGDRPGLHYDIKCPDGTILKGNEHRWRCDLERFEWRIRESRIVFSRNKDGEWDVFYKQYINEQKEQIIKDEHGNLLSYGKIPDTLLLKVGFTGDSKKDLKDLFDDNTPFPYPKPVSLIKHLLRMATKNSDIVLDFFAGSCTTAQAVMELNREDEGNRRFVMIQLPELIDKKKYPEEADLYKTIASIGEERIRRVIARMKQEDESKLELSTREAPEDLGFRVFKLAPSNYKVWKSIIGDDPEAYTKQLDMFAELLVDKWSPINVLWEVAIKEGYGLNMQLERLEKVQDNTVWRISDPDKDQSMLVCLDDELKPSTLTALPLSKEHVFVCRNKALDDTKAANLALQCRLKKI